MGSIEIHEAVVYRAKKANFKEILLFYLYGYKRQCSFKVYHNGFISLHAISNKALARLTNLLNANKFLIDGRGKGEAL